MLTCNPRGPGGPLAPDSPWGPCNQIIFVSFHLFILLNTLLTEIVLALQNYKI